MMFTRSNVFAESLESRRLLASFAPLRGGDSLLADMNNDGKADLVSVVRGGTTPDAVLGIALGRGDGTFRPADRVVIRANTALAIAAGDLNGDGNLDLAIAGDNPLSMGPVSGTFVVTAIGKGDGTFLRAPSSSPATPPVPVVEVTFVPQIARARALAIDDLDGNGHGEVSVLGVTRESSINPENTSIVVNWDVSLDALVVIPPTVIPFNSLVIVNQLHVADLSGDGRTDLLATNRTPMPPSLLTVVRNDAVAVSFPADHTAVVRKGVNPLNMVPPVSTPTPPLVETIGLADLDGDASPDLVGRVNNVLRYTSVRAGSTGLFGPVTNIVAAQAPSTAIRSLQVGDVTGDGLDDVLGASRFGHVLATNITTDGPVSVRWTRVGPALLADELGGLASEK